MKVALLLVSLPVARLPVIFFLNNTHQLSLLHRPSEGPCCLKNKHRAPKLTTRPLASAFLTASTASRHPWSSRPDPPAPFKNWLLLRRPLPGDAQVLGILLPYSGLKIQSTRASGLRPQISAVVCPPPADLSSPFQAIFQDQISVQPTISYKATKTSPRACFPTCKGAPGHLTPQGGHEAWRGQGPGPGPRQDPTRVVPPLGLGCRVAD